MDKQAKTTPASYEDSDFFYGECDHSVDSQQDGEDELSVTTCKVVVHAQTFPNKAAQVLS